MTASGTTVEGLVEMRSMYNSCSRGMVTPTLIVTTKALFESYEGHGEGSKQRVTDMGTLEMGFDNLMFKRTPLVWDEDCPDDVMLFLNANHLKFKVGRGKNFIMTPFDNPLQQEAKQSHVILYANLITNNRARQGRIGDFIA